MFVDTLPHITFGLKTKNGNAVTFVVLLFHTSYLHIVEPTWIREHQKRLSKVVMWYVMSLYILHVLVPHSMGATTIFPVARPVSRYSNASTNSENLKGPLGSIMGFTFPLSR